MKTLPQPSIARPALITSVLAFTLASQACVSVKADVDEMSVTRSNLSFEAVPSALATLRSSTTQSFHYEHSSDRLPASVSADVHAKDVSVVARSGIRDLSFVHDLLLTVRDDSDPSGQESTVLSYEQGDAQPSSSILDMPVNGDGASLDPLAKNQYTYKVTVGGVLPTVSWAVDITIRYAGSFEFQP